MADAVLDRPGSADAPSPALAIVAIALLVLAVAARHELHAYHLHDIVRSLTSISAGRVLAALALTLIGHLVHIGYDALALRYAGQRLPWRRVAFGSLIAYSVSAVTGFTGVVGGSLRYRFWSDRKSTRLNSSHLGISYAVFCLKKTT